MSEQRDARPSPLPDVEVRLAALDEFGILDTPAEQGFDDLTLLASRICDAPVALVSLVDRDRQWFKARIGFPDCETDLSRSVCKFVLAEPDVLVIPDLTLDPRTAANPLVTGEEAIRFYAGAPLRTPEGVTVGSLCVIDTAPRPDGLTEAQRETLRALARQVTMLLDLRRKSAEQSRTAEVLRDSEARVQAMVDQASAGIAQTTLEGRFTFVNDRYCAMLGRSREELLTLRMHDLTHPDNLLGNAAQFRTLAQGGPSFEIEKRYLRPDGTTIWVRNSVTGVRETDGRVSSILAVSLDISEQRMAVTRQAEAEAALRLSESRYRALFENIDAGFCICDVKLDEDGRAVDHRVLDANPAFERYTGLVDAVGRYATEVAPGIEQHWHDAYGNVARTGRPVRFEAEAAPLGRWYEAHLFPVVEGQVAMLITDITSRRRTEATLKDVNTSLERQVGERVREIEAQGEVLRTSQARQRVVFDLTRQLMGIMELDGTLLEANPASLSAIGSDLGQVVGKPFWMTPWFTGTPGMGDAVREAITVARGGKSIRTELPLILPNGETRIYDFGMHPIRDETGRVVEIMPEATDITELRQAEEALRQSQKMEAVGQLTGGLAHDFNNLLAGISGSLELMQSRLQQGRFNDVERYMAAAQGASKRAVALTHRLLAFSRRQTLDPKATDVNRLALGMQEMVQRTVGPGIPVDVVGASGLWTALVDPPQLENALLNLCINARDAMPDGGRITIETANKWMDERAARQHDMPEGQYLSLCVTDTGTGMPPEVVARVFEPFFTTKPIGEGTGLGLSMIYGFAQQSGGQVRIYSEVGLGTTICIYLPRHYGEAEGEDLSEKHAAIPRSEQGETVLVVDDEPTVRMLVSDILEDLGYTAIEAGDSAAGLKVLQSDVRIDLLVTDVGLPGGMNGRQMADAARVSRPDLKVLFITGYAENAVLGNGHLAPGMAVLTKPFPIEAMATRIRAMIESRK